MATFRKKPVEIQAYCTSVQLKIQTLEGEMTAKVGDWVITGVKGEVYPCKDDIFRATYEPVDPAAVAEWDAPHA
jgi:hypothetical protein